MSFSEDIIQKVWEEGTLVPNHDPKVWRKDLITGKEKI